MRFPRNTVMSSVRRMMVVLVFLAVTVAEAQDETPLYGIPVLEGRAVLPADTFADGPASGAAIEATNERTPPLKASRCRV